MQNAHERFAILEFIKRMKDTTTRVRVHFDRVVVDPPKDEMATKCRTGRSRFETTALPRKHWASGPRDTAIAGRPGR